MYLCFLKKENIKKKKKKTLQDLRYWWPLKHVITVCEKGGRHIAGRICIRDGPHAAQVENHCTLQVDTLNTSYFFRHNENMLLCK